MAELTSFISLFHDATCITRYASEPPKTRQPCSSLAALKRARCSHIYEDKGLSGASAERPGQYEIKVTVRQGAAPATRMLALRVQ
jgi:hypothetical protein